MNKETKELLNKHNIKFVTLSNLSGIFIMSKYSVNHISVAENMVELLNNDLQSKSVSSDRCNCEFMTIKNSVVERCYKCKSIKVVYKSR